MDEVYCEVCWTCYQIHKTAEFAQTIWDNGCIHPFAHQWWYGGMHRNLVMVTYHEESGLLLRPFPENVQFYGNFHLCRYNPCPRPQCTYAHTDLELSEWNREKQAQSNYHRRPPPPSPRQPNLGRASLTKLKHRHNYELPPESELDEDLLTQSLTRKNYVDKFHTLLYYEEHEHVRVLKERCDQQLDVFLFDEEGERHGSLVGLSSDDVAYIQQNATHVEIKIDDTIKVSAEIFKYHLGSDELDVVQVKFTDEQFCTLKSKTEVFSSHFAVHFILKHSYYSSLHKSLDRLSLDMIKRLIPLYPTPRYKKLPKVKSYNLLDKDYQQLALKRMKACDSSVPFLVTGPFGTGKTRLLATAAVKFLEMHNSRVLICTSHLQSADAYIDNYFGPMLEDGFIRCSVKRLIAKDYVLYHGRYQHLFTDGYEERERNEIRNCRLIVTTFLKAPHLIFCKVRPFTHILIDEGAQTREPEAIAPLGLADDDTKIVIAGDHLQIGPQVLVAGKKACDNGLGVSLLQRLHCHSTSSSPQNSHSALLLSNYRCHGSILRLSSYLFYNSTLQGKSDASLHPKTTSALVFLCTSINSTITTSKDDFSQEEARTILGQVSNYINPWPVDWGEHFLSTICVVASSRNQVRTFRKLLNHPDFKELKGIKTSTTYELQGREFRAIFISTLEKTKDDGSTSNPTKSICDQYVFNTVITRAQSLVVCVGNPFLLLSIEKSTPGYSVYCWKEYIKRCLETLSLQLAPQCYEGGESVVQKNICELYSEVYEDFNMSLDNCSLCSEVSDSILEAYKRAYQKALRNVKVVIGITENGDTGYLLQGQSQYYEAPEDAPMEGPPIECYLECKTYKSCTAIPLNGKEPPIAIQGLNNRRCALDGAQVKVRVYNDSDRCGRVCEVVEQGPQQQFVCRVDNYNAIFFYPIDRRDSKLVNLPGLSSEMLKRMSDHYIIEKELKKLQLAVTVFDCTSFRKGSEIKDIPQIKDVFPLSIAKKLLFVVWYLRWTPKHRYPLGVVIAAIPKGLTLYHGERLLLAQHHINTAPVDNIGDSEDLTIVVPGRHYDHAFTIDPPEAQAFDDALTLEPVASDDGESYQLGVHITNVGGAVRKGSEVDVGAVERATAVYGSTLSKIYYPLLPRRVRDALSLRCGREAPVISYTCQVCIHNEDVRIVPNTINIHESCVKSRARLTYEEAQHVLTESPGTLLLGKVVDYNSSLPRNSTFALKDRLALLLQISESFFRNRVQSGDIDYSIEDADKLSCPQAHFLVSELMVWANRIAAEHILTAFPQLALLRRQKPPNQAQLERVLDKCKDILAHSPVHKALADNVDVPIEPGPVVMMEFVNRQLYGALQSGNVMKAKNLLRTINYHPQLAVISKEVNSTKCRAEYVCSSVLQQQQPLLLDNHSYLVSLEQDEKEVYDHNDLCCLYTHSTSPLRRYIDILVQRLILKSLPQNNDDDDDNYSAENLVEHCVKCNIKTLNGKKFEKDYNCLSIALSLANCSQFCMVYVSRVEKALNFVIQELDYHCLTADQRSFRLSSITSNTKPQVADTTLSSQEDGQLEGGKEHVWFIKLTSFTDNELVIDKLENVKKNIPKPEETRANHDVCNLIQDARLTFYVPPTPTEQAESETAGILDSDKDLGLMQHCYLADFLSLTTLIGVEDWKKVSDFMKLPSPESAHQLRDLLSNCQHKPNYAGNDSFPQNSSFLLYEVKRLIKVYESFKVSFTASYNEHILSPCIQLLEIAPMLNMCVQHSTKPADCFSNPILSHASKETYNDIHEYIELWESVLLAEAAVQSVGEAEIQLIQNVPLKWPKFYPSTSLDDVYYSPFPNNASIEQDQQPHQYHLSLQTTPGFEERCHDYFDLRVGSLVCARYNIPLGEEKEIDGRKVTTASAVYHFVITHIDYLSNEDTLETPKANKRSENQNGKDLEAMSTRNIYLKFASKNTARVSPFMKQYLKDSTCEIQVIALGIPYSRMYKSLLALSTTKNWLYKDVALGNMTRRIGITGSDERLTQSLQDPLVYELWSGRQLTELNREQKESVEIAMRNKFQLIQGPPGTGKSVIGAHLAYASIIFNSGITSNPQPESDERIRCVMYCGPSNKSVDVVLGTALSKPRSEQECRESHEPYALHKKIRSEDCPYSEKILEMERKFERYLRENRFPSPHERVWFYNIIKEAEAAVIHKGNYQIVFCTCNEAGSVRVTRNIKPTHLIIDEAAMATEPEAMIPLRLAGHVTLIGDHMQLQPVIKYFSAKENGLECSLFERYANVLKREESSLLHMLTMQYRMHVEICKFPSEEFYEGKLQTDSSVEEKFCPIDGFWPNGPNCPIVFCDVEGKEEGGNSDHQVHQESKSNKIEAEKIVEIIPQLMKAIAQSIQKKQQRDKDLKIAVLTPYKAQKYLVQDLLQKEKDLVNDLEKKTITIGTINESQGSEFDYVIFSTVRSMPCRLIKNKAAVQPDRAWITEHLGFITDRHQICVAITRAKYGLIIVGNKMLLKYDINTWDRLLKYYEEKKCVVKHTEFPLSE